MTTGTKNMREIKLKTNKNAVLLILVPRKNVQVVFELFSLDNLRVVSSRGY